MGKGGKGKKADTSVYNRHLFTRISYLHQAASYLQTAGTPESLSPPGETSKPRSTASSQNVARELVASIRGVSRKSQITTTPAMKKTICKYCDTLLIEGRTCFTTVENPSKGAKKPWADVMVIRCKTCDNVKRYPIGCARQKKHAQRAKVAEEANSSAKVAERDSTAATTAAPSTATTPGGTTSEFPETPADINMESSGG